MKAYVLNQEPKEHHYARVLKLDKQTYTVEMNNLLYTQGYTSYKVGDIHTRYIDFMPSEGIEGEIPIVPGLPYTLIEGLSKSEKLIRKWDEKRVRLSEDEHTLLDEWLHGYSQISLGGYKEFYHLINSNKELCTAPILYRGLMMSAKDLKVGSVIELNDLSSWTENIKVAQSFSTIEYEDASEIQEPTYVVLGLNTKEYNVESFKVNKYLDLKQTLTWANECEHIISDIKLQIKSISDMQYMESVTDEILVYTYVEVGVISENKLVNRF